MSDAERYRDKAAEMRVRAHKAVTPDLAAMYWELAQHWDALADRSGGRFPAPPILERERDKREA